MMRLVPIKGAKLRAGMVIRRDPNPKEKPTKLPVPSGGCEKGKHFGAACYDRIGTWFAEF